MSADVRTGVIETDRFEMEYMTFGSGKKYFVIIPGLSLKSVIPSSDAIAAAYNAFADEYTVYLFDRKKAVEAGYTIREMAADTTAAMRQLGIGKADILGVSQGGMIAQYIAVDSPDIVNKLVLGSTLSRPNKTSEAVICRWIDLAKQRDNISLNRSFFEKVYSDEYRNKYKSVLDILEKEGSDEELARFAVLAEAYLGFDAYDELDKIKCPVLVIGAGNDKALSAEASREIADKLKCKLNIYLNGSHAVYDEAPDYKDRILRFFNS